ncbi:MAG: metallophosphoesterase [Alphaproteobacteria bacterium]|nr:metallophosphoesterase [Alphaproteobacteria bacterium]
MDDISRIAEQSGWRLARATDGRAAWRARRLVMQAEGRKYTPDGVRRRRHWAGFNRAVAAFGVGLRLAGLERRGQANATDIRRTEIDLAFADLPPAFDGFRILHVSDLHLDGPAAITEAALDRIQRTAADVAVLTGDFVFGVATPAAAIRGPLRRLRAALGICDAHFAVLGNHDGADLAEVLAESGLAPLVNESAVLTRRGESLVLTGTDDAHYFYTEAARQALASAPEGFRVALVHSPELAGMAADLSHRLYRTGHTHAGQVALPGGRPVITHLSRHRALAAGLWNLRGMVGYTSAGIGTSALPVRFNTRGEVVRITLRRA